MSGTQKGDLPGIPATGKRFSSVRGSIILELEAGKIRRESDYWDAATFMKQVGVLRRASPVSSRDATMSAAHFLKER
jgi:SnoaL-like polyketide cyclase